MGTEDDGDARTYSDVAELFHYTVEDFYALPEATQQLLRGEAARVRRRREAEMARAVYYGTRAAMAEGDGFAKLRQVYPELAT